MADEKSDHVASEDKLFELEKLKLQLGYRKFVLGSVIASITIAAIPPLFQLATAGIEYVKSQHALRMQEETVHETFLTQFLNTALDQDIEKRIRFAHYFSRVSSKSYQQGWVDYRDDLLKRRSIVRDEIDRKEAEWQKNSGQAQNDVDQDILAVQLARLYSETGYLQRDHSVAANPRPNQTPPTAPSTTATTSVSAPQASTQSFYYGEYDRFQTFGPRLSCEDAAKPGGIQAFAQHLCGDGQNATVVETNSLSGNKCGYSRFNLTCTKI